MPSSRVDKYEKRRKNTKRLSLLLILAGVLVIVFLGYLIFGGDSETNGSNDRGTEQTSENSQSQLDTKENSNGSANETDKDDTDENSNSESDEEQGQEQVEPSDDNVQKAYTADWKPVGTEQTGSHTTNYNEGSQDRQEMRKAVAVATDLNESDFIMWWVGRNGDQRVINTVSDPDEKDIYRVYNKWVANKGWQPTKVEKLKENDKKQ